MINAGDLIHRVTILQPVTGADDALGEPQLTWSTWGGPRWASIRPASGRELEVAKVLQATVTHRVQMRWVAGLLPTFRLQYAGRLFAITSAINVDERNDELLIYAEELVA